MSFSPSWSSGVCSTAAAKSPSSSNAASVAATAAAGDIELSRRTYRPSDLEGHFLAIAATSDTDVNVAIFDEAERRAMLCNVVDVPPLCSFILHDDLVLIETLTGEQRITDPAEVQVYERALDRLHAAAATGIDAATLIREIMTTLQPEHAS
jgi:hypothetical protein